jgi:hypothetical protein
MLVRQCRMRALESVPSSRLAFAALVALSAVSVCSAAGTLLSVDSSMYAGQGAAGHLATVDRVRGKGDGRTAIGEIAAGRDAEPVVAGEGDTAR